MTLYTLIGYAIALIIFYIAFKYVSGAVKLVITIIFAALSLFVAYIIFGGLFSALM